MTKKNPPPPSDPLLQRLYRIRDAYDQKRPTYRFSAIFYNVKGKGTTFGGSAFSKKNPDCLTPYEWNQAKADAPDQNFEASVIVGFQQLEERQNSQAVVVDAMEKKLKNQIGYIQQLKTIYDESLIHKIHEAEQNQREIHRRLIHQLQVDEVKALQTFQFSLEEHQILDRLEKLNEEIQKPNQYVAALNTLGLHAALQRDSSAGGSEPIVRDEELEPAEGILRSNNDAIAALTEVMRELERSISAMERALENDRGTGIFTGDQNQQKDPIKDHQTTTKSPTLL